MVWVIVILAVLAVICFISIEVKVRRKPSFEGIEDPLAVKAYDRLNQMPQFAAMRGIFVNELSRHNPRGTLADVGCGPGYLLDLLARRFTHLNLIGVDISPEILVKARQNLRSYQNVDFKLAGSQSLPFVDNSLDFLVSTLSLHHWSQPGQALAEFHRVLRPGGQFLLFDLRRNSPLLAHMVVNFASALVVHRAIRKMKEPLGSLLASYTPAEVTGIITHTSFKKFEIKKGFFWLFVWGEKKRKGERI
jgi:ubiquinone/menaquinone biosynthesis C-methylase UbiE